MPFFCDLFDYTSDSAELPPELIPYTQTLYYDNTDNSSQKEYLPLFYAPWDGKSEDRSVSIGMQWSGQTLGITQSENTQYNTESKSAAEINNKNLQRMNQMLSDLSKGQVEPKTFLAKGSKYLRWFDTLFPELSTEINILQNAVANQTENVRTRLMEILNIGIKEEREKTSTNMQGQRVTKGKDQNINAATYVTVSTDKLKATLNGVDVEVGSKYHEDFTISKTIVCKSSDTAKDAHNTLVCLANYLSRVAPSFAYRQADSKTGDNKSYYSTTNITYTAPNKFRADIKESKNVARFGGSNTIDASKSDKINFDIFNYRGDFQLRQGYNVYRNLIPSKVVVTASQDFLFLKDDPFKEFSQTVNSGSSKIFSNKGAAEGSPAEQLIAVWKASNFLRKVTLYKDKNASNSKEGFLFPQWFNLEIHLTPVEPYDAVRGTQQLFCIADTFVDPEK